MESCTGKVAGTFIINSLFLSFVVNRHFLYATPYVDLNLAEVE